MNCQELNERMIDPVALPQIEQDPQAMEHLTSCSACHARWEYEKKLQAGFQSIVERPIPSALTEKLLEIPNQATAMATQEETGVPFWGRFWFKAGLSAAMAGFLLAVCLKTIQYSGQGPTTRTGEISTAAAPKEKTPETGLAANPIIEPAQPTAIPEPAKPHPALNPAAEIAAASPSETRFDLARLPKEADKAAPTVTMQNSVADGVAREKETGSTPAPSSPPAGGPAPRSVRPGVAPTSESGDFSAAGKETAKKENPTKAEEPPHVVGEPLIDPSEKTKIQLAARKAPQPVASKGSAPAGSGNTDSFSAAEENKILADQVDSGKLGEVMLMKASPEEVLAPLEAAPGDLAQSEGEAGFVQPPPSGMKKALGKREMRAKLDIRRDQRHELIERIVREHRSQVREGPLDIDQWVISKWITVRERIQLSPPPGTRWAAILEGNELVAVLEVAESEN